VVERAHTGSYVIRVDGSVAVEVVGNLYEIDDIFVQ
jgi:hypothetical protein